MVFTLPFIVPAGLVGQQFLLSIVLLADVVVIISNDGASLRNSLTEAYSDLFLSSSRPCCISSPAGYPLALH